MNILQFQNELSGVKNNMKKQQYIVICMDTGKEYVQATRRRFSTRKSAVDYAWTIGISSSRDPHVVAVKAVKIDENGYPT